MTRSQTIKYLVVSLAVFALGLVLVLTQKPEFVGGSVDFDFGGYDATTTTSLASTAVLKSTRGVFGSMVVSKTDTGTMSLYNATTSNVNLRTGNKATTTLLIAHMPTAATAGTYTYDVTFTDGLLVVTTGSPASTTVTWK